MIIKKKKRKERRLKIRKKAFIAAKIILNAIKIIDGEI